MIWTTDANGDYENGPLKARRISAGYYVVSPAGFLCDAGKIAFHRTAAQAMAAADAGGEWSWCGMEYPAQTSGHHADGEGKKLPGHDPPRRRGRHSPTDTDQHINEERHEETV